MHFELVSEITAVLTIACGRGIRDLGRIRRQHGAGRWRKKKGIASARLMGGHVRRVEPHWYEAHGVGWVTMKIKRFVD